MQGKITFGKKINRLQRRANKASTPTIPMELPIPQGIDIGNWRIAQHEDGSLIIYNFETGSSVTIAQP